MWTNIKNPEEIKQKIEYLKEERQRISKKFGPEYDPLINELLACLADQVRILKWVLE